MKPPITVYVPVFNACEWAAAVDLPPGNDYVVLDNGSIDGTGDVFRKRGIQVVMSENEGGRLGNWRACLHHFSQGDGEWMRWLFAGDTLAHESSDLIRQHVQTCPDARIVVGAFCNDLGQAVVPVVRPSEQAEWRPPTEACRRAAACGNWFGPPLSVCLHREVVRSGAYDFGEFEWAADYWAAVSATARFGCLAVPDVFGTFHAARRKFFQAQKDSAQGRLETTAVRVLAARRLLQLGAGRDEYESLMSTIEKDAWAQTFHARITLEHQAQYLDELTARTPLRLLMRVLPSRLARLISRMRKPSRTLT